MTDFDSKPIVSSLTVFIQIIVLVSITITQSKDFYNDDKKFKLISDQDQARFHYWAVKLPTVSICIFAASPLFAGCYALLRMILCDTGNKSLITSKSIIFIWTMSSMIGYIMLLVSTGMMSYNLDCNVYQFCGESFLTLYIVAFWFLMSSLIMSLGVTVGLVVCGVSVACCFSCIEKRRERNETGNSDHEMEYIYNAPPPYDS